MAYTALNPYQNAPKGSPITAVNRGDPAQIGAAIGNNVLGNSGTNGVFNITAGIFSGTLGGISIKYVFYWGIAALALIALAGPMPDLATGFTVLLIVGVLLTHYQDYVKLFSPPSK